MDSVKKLYIVEAAEKTAEKFRRRIEDEIIVTVSVGVVSLIEIVEEEGKTNALIKRADECMYVCM